MDADTKDSPRVISWTQEMMMETIIDHSKRDLVVSTKTA
jgi:hypothetical protein